MNLANSVSFSSSLQISYHRLDYPKAAGSQITQIEAGCCRDVAKSKFWKGAQLHGRDCIAHLLDP